MSQKAGSIGSIVLGVVIIVAGLATYGATWAALPSVIGGALSLAGGAIGLIYQPKAMTQESAKAQDLQFGSSTEGFPVPVIFGEQKVIPNFMNWTADTFRNVEGTVAIGGKGGGGTTQPNGVIDYYLTFELGLCMGPVDEIGQVISVPGDVLCRGANYSIGENLSASQTGVTVTVPITGDGRGPFDVAMAGGTIVWADGTTDLITAYVDPVTLRVSTNQTKTSQRFQIFSKVEFNVFEDGGDDYHDITLSGVNEGGVARVYRGTDSQTRIESLDPYFDTGMNYRNMCWALHIDFWIGRGSPTPKTYQYIIRRLPRCRRDNGDTVTGLETRGSIDPNDPAYYQANPAAVIYEIWTNKLWGRGLSSDSIDEASFVTCSQYFKGKNIGISMTLDSPDKITALIDGLRMQLKIIMTWSGGLWKMRCLMDPNQVAETILTLTADDVDDLSVVRPLWPSTTNDIRAEFNSREKLYKPDTIHVQDMANIELTERVNSRTITLRSFTDWNIAARQATRILMEASYPAATASFYINRFKSRLEIGDVCRIVWQEWGASAVTAYFMITRVQPMGKQDERLKITAVEDSFICPIAGVETSVTLPYAQAWEKIKALESGDLSKFTRPTSQSGSIFPIHAIELPNLLVSPDSTIGIYGVKPSFGTIGAQVYFAPENSSNYQPLPGTLDFALSCVLSTAITHTRETDRSESFVEFISSLSNLAALVAVNTVASVNDDLEAVEASGTNFLIIGEEIIKVGKIEQVSGTLFRATHVVRGCFGSPIDVHASGEQAFFRQTITSGFSLVNLVPQGVVKFKAYPVTAAGVNQVGNDFYIYHNSDFNQQILGLRNRPLPPEIINMQAIGSTLTIRARYRDQNAGASSRPLLGTYNATTNQMTGVILDTHTEDTTWRLLDTANGNFPFLTGLVSLAYNAAGEAVFTYSVGGTSDATTRAYFEKNGIFASKNNRLSARPSKEAYQI